MAAGNIYSVGQVNSYIRRMFAEDYLLRRILVRGEISNCKYHSSGHIYFTLKDASGTLSCIMFASRVRGGLSFRMREGDAVVVEGQIDVWTKGGSYQLYAERIIQDGVGLLNERIELLKKRLEEMGMFDEQYKQPIPRYIRRLGVVTAPTGAAVQDIIHIARRRNPGVEIILYPALVQGEGAAASVANGIRALDTLGDRDPAHRIDVIIVGRGGGSLEDLMAFNDELVAQAIFDAGTPIISAVGHETDTTIADYVADLRAPTPSAGAELAVYDRRSCKAEISGYRMQMMDAMRHRISMMRNETLRMQRELDHFSPAARVRSQKQELIRLQEHLTAAMQEVLRDRRMSLLTADRLSQNMERILSARRYGLEMHAASLDRLSPLKRLGGSYGFVTREDGSALAGIRHVAPGDAILIRMKDGRMHAQITATEEVSIHG